MYFYQTPVNSFFIYLGKTSTTDMLNSTQEKLYNWNSPAVALQFLKASRYIELLEKMVDKVV